MGTRRSVHETHRGGGQSHSAAPEVRTLRSMLSESSYQNMHAIGLMLMQSKRSCGSWLGTLLIWDLSLALTSSMKAQGTVP